MVFIGAAAAPLIASVGMLFEDDLLAAGIGLGFFGFFTGIVYLVRKHNTQADIQGS